MAFTPTSADQAATSAQGVFVPGQYRHPKENLYFLIAAITGGIIWIAIVLAIISLPLLILYVVFFGLAFAFMLFTLKAYFFGNALNVNDSQCSEIYNQVKVIGGKLGVGVGKLPYVFVVNGNGMFNAFALRFVGRGYVVLMSSLVDHYLREGRDKELHFIIAHELAHHAAGHTALWKVLLTGIASWVPFLGKAYGRACEYTCDRAGVLVLNDRMACERSLLSLVHGSEALQGKVNTDLFLAQEQHVPSFFGFLLEICSTHPRLTRRIQAVRTFLSA